MILASHVILSAYGFWLPNDPRGSWSDFVRAWELLRYGKANPVPTRASVAQVEHDRDLRLRAKDALRFPPVSFTGEQARCVASGFARIAHKTGAVVHACAILPEHVHLVIARHRYRIGQVVNLMKGGATTELLNDGLHPLSAYRERDGSIPSPWGRRFWEVFIDQPDHLRCAAEYVEQNPVKEGKARQTWKFVSPLN